ncbi:MAG: hypothetical protein ACMUHB_04790 [Thermoplasmatota archaeon]
MAWDWNTILIVAAIVALVLAWFLALVWLIRLRRKRKLEPSHIDLYFGENFRKIMGEWDFVTRDRVKDFKKDMGKRLSIVGSDIDGMEKRRNDLDRRMGSLERTIAKLEGV